MNHQHIRLSRSTPGTLAIVASLLIIPSFTPQAFAQTADASAKTEKTTTLTAVVGGQSVNKVAPRGLARFNEFREIPEGAVFEFGQFTWSPKDSHLYLAFTAVDVA